MLPYVVLLAMGLAFLLGVGLLADWDRDRQRRRRIQRLQERRRYLDTLEPHRWDTERKAA